MRHRIVDSIDQIDPERWDAVAGGEIAMSHRWQRVMEASRRGYRPRYILLEDEHGPLATAVVNTAEEFGRSGWREALMRRLTAVVGATFSSRHCGVAARPGVGLAVVLPGVERALADLCRREARPLLAVKSVAEEQLPVLRARGYFASRQPNYMVLDLPVSSYEGYLELLSGRDRAELRRVRRRGADSGAELSLAPLDGQGDRLFPLMAEIYARHGKAVAAMPLTSELFPALEREMPGEAIVFSGTVDGKLAGFFLGLRQGDELLAPVAGLRYELAHPSCLYFLLIDQLVRWSTERGLRRIYAGMSNEQQKARHGFRPQARWFCVRANPGPVNRALGLALARRGGSSSAAVPAK
ncbi:MAG TPA: GNAT family N-acetyltransferase [Chloroflexota bacterium]|jgi:predicted N-acyltransferase